MSDPTLPTYGDLKDRFQRARKQLATWICLTSEFEGAEQKEARVRSEEIRRDIRSAEALVKNGQAQAAFNLLAAV